MKKIYLWLLTFALIQTSFAQQNIGINNPAPDPSAVLDIAATDKGLLIPRLTETQRKAITAPATGLMVFQTDDSVGFWYYVNTGGWTYLSSDNLGNHTLTKNLNTNGKEIRGGNYAGLSIAADGQVTIGTTNRNISGADIDNNKLGLWLNNTDAGLVVSGNIGYGQNSIPVTGAGARMMWYPFYAAFRAGGVTSNEWDYTNTGFYSTAFGYRTIASEYASFAAGDQSQATEWGSVALGYKNIASGKYSFASGNTAQASAESSVAIGKSVIASADNATAMGNQTTASGTYSFALGNLVSTSARSGSFIFGDRSVSTIAGLTSNDAGNQMMMRFANGYKLYTNSTATVGVQVAAGGNAWSTISDSTRKENFAPVNGEDFLQKISRFNLTSWNYKGQDRKTFRHYGPMAQDFYAAFGTDKFGTIGNETSINQADFDGINLIAIQALEKRTAELKKENELLKKQLSEIAQDKPKTAALKKENKLLKARFGKLENEVAEIKALLQAPGSNLIQATNTITNK